MGTHTMNLADHGGLVGACVSLTRVLWSALGFAFGHLTLLAAVAAAMCVAWVVLEHKLTEAALAQRTYVRLVPASSFETGAEEVLRQGMQLIRAASAGPWWAPRAARSVRIRMRSDGTQPLSYQLEGPKAARHLLINTPYARVRTEPGQRVKDRDRKHTVRAVYVLHGDATAPLRDVPLEPDPMQPMLDAVAALRADLGDLAEMCLDLSPAGRWRMAARRWQVLNTAREKARRDSRREARWMASDALSVQDSLTWQLRQLLSPGSSTGPRGGALLAPRPPRIDAASALGKFDSGTGLVRVQLLVRCSSDLVGRAELRMRHIGAALDVFAARARWAAAGKSLGPWHFGPDRWPWRRSFDQRWDSGLIRPGRDSWVHLTEIAGLLKPVTRHATLPVLVGDIPSFEPGQGLLPQGVYRGPDGRERLLATREQETLFEVAVGKAGYGKTERALVQAVAHANNGGGLGFVDPHRDSWPRAMPFLAHRGVMGRVWLIDLTSSAPGHLLPSWNPLSMVGGPAPDQVVSATVDALAASLGWGDVNTPRALTILIKSVEALVTVNQLAVRSGHPECQATVFQIRPLLTNVSFREAVVGCLRKVDPEAADWWGTAKQEIAEGLSTVLNPLTRLAASPQIRAFLGQPVGVYDARRAMDEQRIVWICPPGTGPTHRLLLGLILRDILRAALSRKDTPEAARAPWRAYLDELIALDDVSGEVLAEITEQGRKFGLRLHGMTQLLDRISPPTRVALVQNASTLSTTAGSKAAVSHIIDEWDGRVSPGEVIELPRYHHYASFTVAGRRVGPLLVRGVSLEETFKPADAKQVKSLERAVIRNSGARPLGELVAAASRHHFVVQTFLVTGQGPSLTKKGTPERTVPWK